MARLMAVAPSAEQAERGGAPRRRLDRRFLSGPSAVGAQRAGGADPVERYVNEVIIHGTPESVIDQIRGLQESGVDYLLCAPLSHESFLLMTDKVLPRLG